MKTAYRFKKILKGVLCVTILLTAATSHAGKAAYVYDTYDRLDELQYQDGPAYKYNYDNVGNLISKQNLGNRLRITFAGDGEGSVSVSSFDDTCGTDCYTYNNPTVVTLTAAPADGTFAFGFWSDASCGTSTTCVVNVNSLKSITANFTLLSNTLQNYSIVSSFTTGGSVYPSEPQVAGYGEIVTLEITPDEGIQVGDVSGCGGTLTDNIYMTAPVTGDCSITVGFKFPLTVIATGPGTGFFSSDPNQLSCSSNCVGYFAPGTEVALQAWPDYDQSFTGWSGEGCRGRGGCVVTINGAATVTGEFKPYAMVVSVSTGRNYTVAVRADGTLWKWGGGVTIPTRIGEDTDWVAVAGGEYHMLALKDNGTLWAWGDNSYGQLGDNSKTYRYAPVPVAGSNSDWVFVTAGGYHTLAIKDDGTLWAWGRNTDGQLGLGTNSPQLIPALVASDLSWETVKAGQLHTIGIKEGGSLWTWGDNYLRQLGDGTGTPHWVPTQIELNSTWKSVGAGSGHSMAIKEDGTLWSWGRNNFGQLGLGGVSSYPDYYPLPTMVSSDKKWVKVMPGMNHTLAIKEDGTLWAWGWNEFYQLGTGWDWDKYSPVQVTSSTNWLSGDGAFDHSAAIKMDGSLWTWGDNFKGEIGDGTYLNVVKVPKWVFGQESLKRTVNILVSEGGGVSPGISQIVDYGSRLSFTITPDPDYLIVSAAGCGGTLDGDIYSVGPVLENCTVSVKFGLSILTIAASAGDNGSINPQGDIWVDYGENAYFNISAYEGYHVQDVLVDGDSVGAVNFYTFTSVTANHSIEASFAVNSYTLSVGKTGDGKGVVRSEFDEINCGSSCSAIFGHLSTVTLTAVPNKGSVFSGWTGGGCTGTETCSLTMTGDNTLEAMFDLDANAVAAHYKLDGNAEDSSGNENHGIVYGAAPLTGRFGNVSSAFTFNGIDNYISVNDAAALNPSSELTLSAWVNISQFKANPDGNYVIVKDDVDSGKRDYALAVVNNVVGFTVFTDNGNGVAYGGTLSLNNWHHIAGTYNGTDLKVYVDGLLVKTEPFSGALMDTDTPLRFGVSNDSSYSGRFFHGGLDDVRIYGRALPAEEMREMYLSRAHYDLNGDAEDSSGYDNHGTVTGAIPAQGRFSNASSAYAFDGVDDYIAIPDAPSLNSIDQLSVSAWINVDELKYSPAADYVVVKDNVDTGEREYLIGIQDASVIFGVFTDNGVGTTMGGTTSANVWHHVVGTFDGSQIKIYLDGVLVKAKAFSGNLIDTDTSLRLGSTNDSLYNDRFLKGRLDDVRIFDKALSGPEVQMLYNEN